MQLSLHLAVSCLLFLFSCSQRIGHFLRQLIPQIIRSALIAGPESREIIWILNSAGQAGKKQNGQLDICSRKFSRSISWQRDFSPKMELTVANALIRRPTSFFFIYCETRVVPHCYFWENLEIPPTKYLYAALMRLDTNKMDVSFAQQMGPCRDHLKVASNLLIFERIPFIFISFDSSLNVLSTVFWMPSDQADDFIEISSVSSVKLREWGPLLN